MRTTLLTSLAVVMILSGPTLSGGCGADDLNAPPVWIDPPCPSVDSYLQGIYGLMEEGQLDHLQSMVRDGLTDSERHDVVLALINIVDQFEPGAFSTLNDVTSNVSLSGEMQTLIADVLRWMSLGETAPALAATRTMLATCEGPPTLTLVRDLLADEALMNALASVLDSVGGTLAERIGGIRWNGAEGQTAIRALVQNLLASATNPGFDISTVIDLLAFIVDVEAPPWSGLVDALQGIFDDPERRDRLQALLLCVRDVDPDLALIDLIVALLTDEELDIGPRLSAQLSADDTTLDDAREGLDVLKGPIETVLDLLIVDTFTRQSLATAMRVGLMPKWAPGVMGDLANLFEADVLDPLVELVAAVADQECLP